MPLDYDSLSWSDEESDVYKYSSASTVSPKETLREVMKVRV